MEDSKTRKTSGHSHGHGHADVHSLGENLTRTAEDAYLQAEDMVEKAKSEVKRQSAEIRGVVESYVQEQPIKALAIAALAGMCIAFFLRK